MSLHAQPPDVLRHIFSYLGVRDSLSILRTCKKFYDVFDTNGLEPIKVTHYEFTEYNYALGFIRGLIASYRHMHERNYIELFHVFASEIKKFSTNEKKTISVSAYKGEMMIKVGGSCRYLT